MYISNLAEMSVSYKVTVRFFSSLTLLILKRRLAVSIKYVILKSSKSLLITAVGKVGRPYAKTHLKKTCFVYL